MFRSRLFSVLARSVAWLRRMDGSLTLRTAVFGLVACLALLSVEAWSAFRSREARMMEAEAAISNLARSLAQHSEDLLSIADTVLLSIVEVAQHNDPDEDPLVWLNAMMTRQALILGRGLHFSVFDEQGAWRASSDTAMTEGLNNSDRDYFRWHRDEPWNGQEETQRGMDRTGAYLGPPVHSKVSGAWLLTLSRRIATPEGGFAGVAVATIDLTYLTDYYAKLSLGQRGVVVLFRRDGTVLARHPMRDDVVGQAALHREFFARRVVGQEQGKYQYISPVDGVERLGAYHPAERYPLLVLASVSVQEALLTWREGLGKRVALTGALTLILAYLGIRLTGTAQERHRVAQALSESEARFRLLAENSSDVVMRVDARGIARYVSPAVLPWLGWEPERLVSLPMTTLIHREDQPDVQGTLSRMAVGMQEEARHTLRLRRRDGGWGWAELALRAVRDPDNGVPDGAVIIARDIDEHKAREERLHVLASTDGLTGLANRRAFDDALEREWRRMLRNEGPLSLLLLDLDRFKTFNDRYGHPQGDRCLQAVAAVLSDAARRPGDLAARYGGEELVLLLPETDSAGALRRAEAVRAAIEALQWPHEDNLPGAVVTVSIGVATSEDGQGLVLAADLLKAADGALYVAKAAGRNRVALAGLPEPLPRANGGPGPTARRPQRRAAVIPRNARG